MKLKDLRESNSLTQLEVAKGLGVTQQYISILEKGKLGGLSLTKLNKLSKILKINEHDLLDLIRKDEKSFLKNQI